MELWNNKRRKHHALTLDKKLELITRLEAGESANSLATYYNIGKSTISDIWYKKDRLFHYAKKLDMEGGSLSRKTMRTANDVKLDNAVYTWYLEQSVLTYPVTGPTLCAKALELNAQLGGSADFKASNGWLKNFKSRHGIGECIKSETAATSWGTSEDTSKVGKEENGLPSNNSDADVISQDHIGAATFIKQEPLYITDHGEADGSVQGPDSIEEPEEPSFEPPSSSTLGSSRFEGVTGQKSDLGLQSGLENECEAFGRYVAACLMRLPAENRLSVENSIFQLLMREKVTSHNRGNQKPVYSEEIVQNSSVMDE